MRRREFIGLVGSGIAWPAVARAQQQSVPTIGFLSSRSPEDSKPHLEGFLRGLGAFGYIEGKTAKIEYRWANGQYDQLRKLAAELAALQPALIAAAGGAPSARAAKSVTTSIPIGFLTNKKGVQSSLRQNDFELAVAAMGRESVILEASDDAQIENSFSMLAQKKVSGLVVENDPFFDSRRLHLIQLTAQRSIPAIYHIREFPLAGGLMSYGTNLVDAYNQMGVLAGRILKGANITDLPVSRPTKFELALNLGTAKTLGLTIPTTVLAIADELID